jgi:hypothetical protein
MGDRCTAVALTVKNVHSKLKIVELDAVVNRLNHSYIEEYGPTTLAHFPNEKLYWNDNKSNISLRPGEEATLYVAYIARRYEDSEPSTILGKNFYHPLFDRESVFQFSVTLMCKLDVEMEFKNISMIRVLYSNPQSYDLHDLELFSGLRRYAEIPDPFKKVWENSVEGNWMDYGNPSRRHQEYIQKQKRSVKPINSNGD